MAKWGALWSAPSTYSGLKFHQLSSELEDQEIVLGQGPCSRVVWAGEFLGGRHLGESAKGGEGEGGVDRSYCHHRDFTHVRGRCGDGRSSRTPPASRQGGTGHRPWTVDDITPGRAARLDHARVPKTDLVLSGVGHAHTTVGCGTGWRSPPLSPDTHAMPTPSEASGKDVLSSESSTRTLLVHVRGTLSTGHSL